MTPQPDFAAESGNTAQLAAACTACHRADGGSSGIASLVGMPESAIVSAMLAYRTGQRESQIMHVVATALTPEEIAAVAHTLAARR